jgi:hypothetical protein
VASLAVKNVSARNASNTPAIMAGANRGLMIASIARAGPFTLIAMVGTSSLQAPRGGEPKL